MASFPKAGPRGLEGPIGPAGPQGVQGPTGKEGPQGPDGKGTVGAEGPQGPAGPQGSVGPAGPQGNTGPEGLKGATGAQGEKGAKGDTGAQGAKGDTGAQGEKGAKGDTGPEGLKGATGAQGEKGAPGPEPTSMPESGVTGLIAHLETLERKGLPEKFWWALTGLAPSFGQGFLGTTAAAYWKFVPRRNMIVRGLSFVVATAATKNDECVVALKAANGKTTLATSGAVSGKLNGAGRQDVDFTADVELVAGTTYYPAIQQNTIGENAASFVTWNLVTTLMASLLGSNPGEAFLMSANPTFPFADEPTPTATQTSRPLLIVRER